MEWNGVQLTFRKYLDIQPDNSIMLNISQINMVKVLALHCIEHRTVIALMIFWVLRHNQQYRKQLQSQTIINSNRIPSQHWAHLGCVYYSSVANSCNAFGYWINWAKALSCFGDAVFWIELLLSFKQFVDSRTYARIVRKKTHTFRIELNSQVSCHQFEVEF